MIGTAKTHLQWLKMIHVRNCGKIINDTICPCANDLRKILLRIPINIHDEKLTNMKILESRIKYNKCKNRWDEATEF